MKYNPIPSDATEVKAKLIKKGKDQILRKLQLLHEVYANGDPLVIEQVFGVIYDDVKTAASDMDGSFAPIYQEIRNRPAPSVVSNLISGKNLEEMADVIWESMLRADPSYNDLSTPDRKFVSKRFLSYLHGSFMVDPSWYLEDYFQIKDDLQAMYSLFQSFTFFKMTSWKPPRVWVRFIGR